MMGTPQLSVGHISAPGVLTGLAPAGRKNIIHTIRRYFALKIIIYQTIKFQIR
jgi:hypothetical protein